MIIKKRIQKIAVVLTFFFLAILVVSCSTRYLPNTIYFTDGEKTAGYNDFPEELNVVSYNVFLRPRMISSADYTMHRAMQIGRWLVRNDVDIVTLQEAWERDAITVLLEQVRHKFPYIVVEQPDRTGLKSLSGGLIVLSRWPIKKIRSLVYDDCSGYDCYSSKGLVHVVLNINNTTEINLITTHLDAGNDKNDRLARVSQLNQFRQYISAIDRANSPTLITGDFNINSLSDSDEFDRLVNILDVEDYHVPNPSTINCEMNASIHCEEPAPPKRLDYIFIRNGGNLLVRTATQHLALATNKIGQFVRFLSDHRAVWAKFKVNLGSL